MSGGWLTAEAHQTQTKGGYLGSMAAQGTSRGRFRHSGVYDPTLSSLSGRWFCKSPSVAMMQPPQSYDMTAGTILILSLCIGVLN